MVSGMEFLQNPISEIGKSITSSELRDTAYEILIGACRSSTGSKPLTYTSQSERTSSTERDRSSANTTSSLTTSPSLQRSMTSAAASKVKKALGISRSSKGERRSSTVGEMIRVQMRVSEQTDSRVRRAFLRIAAGQLGRRAESIVVPLELLQQVKPSDFRNHEEFEAFQKRSLKMLEAGLLLYPHVPLDKSDTSAQKLKKMIQGASEKVLETGKNSEFMQVLRTVVMTLAYRSFDGQASNMCHWADGFPLNLQLYQMLLEACFDVDDETNIVEEVDEVLELIKKTWVILGMNQELHNLCFLWVLFHRYVETGEIEDDLLFAASNLINEVEVDAKTMKDLDYSKVLSSALTAIMGGQRSSF
ncbi:Protein unc-13-like protein [Bienertia sinuspersici]